MKSRLDIPVLIGFFWLWVGLLVAYGFAVDADSGTPVSTLQNSDAPQLTLLDCCGLWMPLIGAPAMVAGFYGYFRMEKENLLRVVSRPSPQCWSCGYPLTGVASDCCPECGTVPDPGRIRAELNRRATRAILARHALSAAFSLAITIGVVGLFYSRSVGVTVMVGALSWNIAYFLSGMFGIHDASRWRFNSA